MIFFCCVILLLKACKQRANTSGTRVNTLVCIRMSICMGPYSQHLCKYKLIHVNGCGKGNKKTRIKMKVWIQENVYFPVFVLLPSSLLLDKGFKNCAHTKSESGFGIRLSDVTSKQKGRRKNSSCAQGQCPVIVSSQYSQVFLHHVPL